MRYLKSKREPPLFPLLCGEAVKKVIEDCRRRVLRLLRTPPGYLTQT